MTEVEHITEVHRREQALGDAIAEVIVFAVFLAVVLVQRLLS